MPPTKEAQEAEARARSQAGIDPGERAAALDVIDDQGAPGQIPAQTNANAAPEPQRPLPPTKGKYDDRRAEIVARFRTHRTEEVDAADDVTEFTRSGMPPEFAEPNAPVVDLEPEPAADNGAAAEAPAPHQPQTVRVKVRGVEQDLPLEDVIAKAQIALAADSYLEDAKATAKAKLSEVDSLLEDARNRVQRVDQAAQHQGVQNAQPEPALDPGDVEHHDAVSELIETLQYGDSGKARELLQNTIAESADRAVREKLAEQRLRDEGARSAKVLQDFIAENAEYASDPVAHAAMERLVYDQQVADLKALGIDPAKLRPDGVTTPGDVAMAHRYYRAEGFKVRSSSEMLATAKNSFLAWRGVGTTNDTPAPAPAAPTRAAPRIDVSVNRTERRQAIPQQPTRTAMPPADARAQTPQPRDRSQIVAQEMARRNLPRGRILA